MTINAISQSSNFTILLFCETASKLPFNPKLTIYALKISTKVVCYAFFISPFALKPCPGDKEARFAK